MKCKIGLLLLTFLMVLFSLPGMVWADNPITVKSTPQIINFEDETVGEYTGDMRYHEENANYSIMEEAGTKFLRMSIPEGATGTPGLDLIKDREVEGEVTFEIRIRMSNFNNSGGSWQHNLRYDAITASGVTRQILWSNTTDFCTGAAITETDGTITDSTGKTTAACDGKRFYKTTSLADQWYRLRFTINPDTNKCYSAAYTDDNQFLGSAEWTSLTDFGSVVKGLRILSPYTNTSNGTITRRLDLDVSEIKITEESQSGESEENWVTTVTDFEDETVGEYTGELLYSTDNAEYSIGEDSGTKFLRMSIPEGAQGEPRIYLMRNQQMAGKITVEARYRTSNFVTIGGSWQAHLQLRVMDKNLFWMNQTEFTTGAGANQYATVTDAEGATRQVSDGSYIYRPGSNFDNVWLRMKVEIDPDTGKTLTSFYDDDGEFLFSQDFILPTSIPDRTVTECYFRVPYAWSQDGALIRRVDLDISEIKVSYLSQDVAPKATNVSISKEGTLLTGNYTYSDANEDAEQGSTYRFLRGTDLDDIENWEAVASGTCTADQLPTYEITEDDYEHYIIFEITPKTEIEPTVGTTVRSEALAMPCVPVASDVEIQGGCVVGREVLGSYTYFDANEGEEEQGSLYRWLISDSENGSYEAIDGATEITFAIPEGYGGKYLKFEVTPKNGIDDDNSAAVTSEAYLITDGNIAPTATNVMIEGEAAVSSKLTGNYTFFDENGDAEGESIYQWFVADTEEDEPIIIAQETGKELVVSSLFAEKYLYFQVTPVDEFGKAGTPVMSSPVKVAAKQINSLYVSLDGNDENDGTLEHPFATLEKARDTIRKWREQGKMPAGGITVYLRGGVYTPSQTFTLEEQDSGTEDAPIVYRPYQDEKVTISGGIYLDYSKFEPVSGEMKNRLVSEDAQNHVLVADLDELGIGNMEKYPLLKTASIIATPMFVFDGNLLQLSRWPNESTNTNWPKMNCGNNYPGTRVGDKNIAESGVGQGFIVKYDTTRPEQWSTNLTDIIASGYWMYDWYAEAKYVKNIDNTKQLLESDGGTWYGVNTSLAKPFRFFNVYEEIDVPGEWYIDRNAGKMYMYPLKTDNPAPVFKMTKADFNLISLQNTSYVEFYNIEVTLGKKYGIVVDGGEGNRIVHCNINTFEEKGIAIKNGNNNGVIDSTIAMCGIGGMDLLGGDTYNIVPAENYAKNNVFNDFSLLKETYAPAIELNGVGNLVQQNEFFNSPHQVIQFHGIDHIIEYNIFHDVCLNAADMGAIYTGRNLYDHDTVIRYNYFYNVGNQQNSNFAACGVFTDDGSSDLWVYGNIFGPGMVSCEAIKIHGGMRNSITNNVFLDIPDAIYLADRTDAQFKQWINGGQATLTDSLKKSLANSVHMERWPWVKTFENGGYQYFPNTFGKNVLFYIDEGKPNSYYRIWNGHALNEINTNLVVSEDQETSKAYFEDYDEGNYTLTSAAYTTIRESIPDFEEIPFQAIGPKPIANQLPTVSSIRILGDPTQSTVLMGDYTYADKERDPEGISTYRWLVSDSLEGTYQPIAGATEKTLTITDDLSGKYVKFEVVPIDDQGNQGTAYLSSAMRIIVDRSSLLTLIEMVSQKTAQAQPGTDLGQYPQSSIDEMKAAIAVAQAAYDNESLTLEDIVEAADTLEQAYQAFQKTQIIEKTFSNGQGSITIPAGLPSLTLHLTDVTGEISLTVPEGGLPQTNVTANVNGKEIKISIPSETVTKAGTFLLICPKEEASIPVYGTIEPIISVGNPGETYQKPIRIFLTNSAGKSVLYINNGSSEKVEYHLSADDGQLNQNKFGTISIDQDLALWTTVGGEYVFGNFVQPSTDASLAAIYVNGKKLANFSAEKYSYSYYVTGTSIPTITVETIDENAKAEISMPSTLPGTVTIIVTAQDGTRKEYTVSLLKQEESTTTPPVIQPTPDYHPNGTGNNGIFNPGINQPTTNNENTARFSDIIGHWAEKDIEEMAKKGIVSGVTDTTFEPDRAITRAEFAALIVRALNISVKGSFVFQDVQPTSWYADAVAAAEAADLMVGSEGYFRPEENITREEMAVVIVKAYQMLGKTVQKGSLDKFKDQGDISKWAKDSVAYAVGVNLISGMTADIFAPQENATRAQVTSLIKRLLIQ